VNTETLVEITVRVGDLVEENQIIKTLIGEMKLSNSAVGNLLEEGIEWVPYAGKIYQGIKLNRLQKRFNEHQAKFNEIGKLLSETSMSATYISERIFPIVLSDLIEEHEDAKINLILTGFENVFIEEKTEESVVINYFDSLRELRYADIMRFYYLSNVVQTYKVHAVGSDEHALIRNIDKKLENRGLISIKKTYGAIAGQEADIYSDNVQLTLYGRKFLDFILDSNTSV
jgi:hypothetical protein